MEGPLTSRTWEKVDEEGRKSAKRHAREASFETLTSAAIRRKLHHVRASSLLGFLQIWWPTDLTKDVLC